MNVWYIGILSVFELIILSGKIKVYLFNIINPHKEIINKTTCVKWKHTIIILSLVSNKCCI